MRQELVNLLSKYLSGEKSLDDCYEWLSGVSWDSLELRTDPTLKNSLGRLELLATEAAEKMRPRRDFQRAASEIMGLLGIEFLPATERSTPTLFLQLTTAYSTASAPVAPVPLEVVLPEVD